MASLDILPEPAAHDKRRRWIILLFAAWTIMATAASVWMVHDLQSPLAPTPLRLDTSPDSKVPLTERIHVWLRLADFNFHGAYPWILLAPYVALLGVLHPLERGRLRLAIPIHLSAYAAFALVSHLLTNRIDTRGVGIVLLSDHQDSEKLTAGGTNSLGLPRILDWKGSIGEKRSSTSHIDTTALLAHLEADTPAQIILQNPFPMNHLTQFVSRTFIQGARTSEVIRTENENFPGTNGFRRITTTFSSSFQMSPRPFSLFLDLLAYGSLVGCAHAVHFYRRFREREQRAIQLESHLAQAKLHALQSQLHPHFLFNALNAVATLIRQDADAALEALTSFSELLRLALNQSGRQEIPLREDLCFLERYVEIQQIRLGDRFRFESQIDPTTLDFYVPALLLQPIVENSLRHGIEPSPRPGIVRLEIKSSDERLILAVEDNGIGLSADVAANRTTGIGLANLRTRLRMLYGENQQLSLTARELGGVVVRIEIPRRNEPSTPLTPDTARS